MSLTAFDPSLSGMLALKALVSSMIIADLLASVSVSECATRCTAILARFLEAGSM